MSLSRSLSARLSLVLLVLLLLLGGVTLMSQFDTFHLYQAEIDQKLNRDLPQKIIASQGWEGGGVPAIEETEPLFHDLMMLNPSIELYVLDTEGRIVGFSAEKPLLHDRVELQPIFDWLTDAHPLPILGSDPRGSGQKVFSAAPLFDEASPGAPVGYLYIVLPSQLQDSVQQMVEGSYIVRLGVRRTLAAGIVALVVGLLLFHVLTRRLRRLSGGIDAFRRRGIVPAPLRRQANEDGDELARLTSSFVTMADQISAQLDDLVHADAQRRELVAGISHDLRTPLTILRGYLETLQLKESTLSTHDRRRSIEAALRQAEHLSELVGQLFELAKLDSGAIEIAMEPFAIGDLVQDVVQKFSLNAADQGVTLASDCQPGLPLVVGDLRLVERALDNLLDNALRHTPHGGQITVGCRNGGPRVQVEVADNGEGIADEELGRIFDPFYRPSTSGPQGAAGLGLAIVQRVVELHEGRIEVESTRGEGTLFRFRLPVCQGLPAG